MVWTDEAKEALDRAPWVIRALIRRRVEEEARKEGRDAIDLDFLIRIKEQQGSAPRQATGPAQDSGGRERRIGEDVIFLAELLDQYCATSHGETDRRTVGPAGVLTPYLVRDHSPSLCADCKKLFLHVAAKRTICPHDPKPSCRHCKTPCQEPEYRRQMSEVMAWNVKRPESLKRDAVRAPDQT